MKRDTSIARKIWEKHNGHIPKDKKGRSYDIHHIDGNNQNNNISNLKAVSLEEHWQIHFENGEYAAANLIADRIDGSYYTGWSHNEITKKKIGDANKKHVNERMWITNGIESRVIKKTEIIPNGWKRGRAPLTEETKQKLVLANLGKKQSEETKKKKSEKIKGTKRSEQTKQKQRDAWTEDRKKSYGEWTSKNRSGENNPMYGKKPWNWMLTKDSDDRIQNIALRLSHTLSNKNK